VARTRAWSTRQGEQGRGGGGGAEYLSLGGGAHVAPTVEEHKIGERRGMKPAAFAEEEVWRFCEDLR